MKSFLSTTRNFWQIRLRAINVHIRIELAILRNVRAFRIGYRDDPDYHRYRRNLVMLRAAKVAALASMRSLGHVA